MRISDWSSDVCASDLNLKDYDLSSLKFCASGGAPLPAEVQDKFENITGCKMIEGWGMTETSPAGTQTVYGGKRKRGSCGLPLPGVTIDIVDVDNPLQVLGINQTGEICTTGPNVLKGHRSEERRVGKEGGSTGIYRG